jgi:hypothetical protein
MSACLFVTGADSDDFEVAGDEVEAARVEAAEDNAGEVAAGRPAKEATDRQEAALLELLRAQEAGP